MENLNIKNSEIRIALQKALIGEVYPDIRKIVYKYEADKKNFTLIYYLDRKPTEEDYENIGKVMTKFISNFPDSAFDELSQECIYSDLLQSKLGPLNSSTVYSRKEY